MQLRTWSSHSPIRTLLLCFCAWKTLLLLIAACSPGPGYDTSTGLSLSSHIEDDRSPIPFHYMISKLIRWDAIYFVKVANRGYLFEQEWAFGWGFTRLISLCTTAIVNVGVSHYEGLEGLVAIFIAHSAHLLSSIVLFKLTAAVFPSSSSLALTTSLLHVVSPAGIFLSAPYAESSYALLSFSGCLLFANSLGPGKQPTWLQDFFVLASGILFGIATTFRSNGILNGFLLLEEAIRTLLLFRRGFHLTTARRLIASGVGGLGVAAGFLLPQYIAYNQYCSHTSIQESRSWCKEALPSIYTFVQNHYWNVGLFRYWTLSNAPLFLLATPVAFIMIKSAKWALEYVPTDAGRASKEKAGATSEPDSVQVLRNLATSQLVLSILTLTTAHVQIITRLSSAYPVWLWYLIMLYKEGKPLGKIFVGFMVIYSIVQAGLFASFLPPA